MSESGGTISAPTVLENGMKVSISPSLRWRDTHKIVVDDRVDRLALQRHVGRLAAAEALHLEGEAALRVEAVVLDHVELPVDRAELEHADLDRAEILRRPPSTKRARGRAPRNLPRRALLGSHPPSLVSPRSARLLFGRVVTDPDAP